MFPPKDEDELYVCIAFVMAVYLILKYLIEYFRGGKTADTGRAIIERTFNAATFGGSAMLLFGIVYPDVLKAMGNLKPFLLFASFAGVVYGLRALLPDW